MNKEKIVLPKKVAEEFEDNFFQFATFSAMVIYIRRECGSFSDVTRWLNDPENEKKLMRVWLGEEYEVEEPLYYVEIPDGEVKEDCFSLRKFNDGHIELYMREAVDDVHEEFKLTEKEIKSVDERFWVFAKPVKD